MTLKINTSKLEKIAVGAAVALFLASAFIPDSFYEKSKIRYEHLLGGSVVVGLLGMGLCAYNSEKLNKQADYQI